MCVRVYNMCVLFKYGCPFQRRLHTWRDGSPYIFTNWAYPGHFRWPIRRRHCGTWDETHILPLCIDINDTGIYNIQDVMNDTLQPRINAADWTCSAVLLQEPVGKWIKIPCDMPFRALVICEASFDIATRTQPHHPASSIYHSAKSYVFTPEYYYYFYMYDFTHDHVANDLAVPNEMYAYIEYPDYNKHVSISDPVPSTAIYDVDNYTSSQICDKYSIYIDGICLALSHDYKYTRNIDWHVVSQQHRRIIVTYIQQWLTFIDAMLFVQDHSSESPKCTILQLLDDVHQYRALLEETDLNVPCTEQVPSIFMWLSPAASRDGGCQPGTRQCPDKTCISADYLCDGSPDCHDGHDEQECPQICNANDHSLCRTNCASPDCICAASHFQCFSGGCVSYLKLSILFIPIYIDNKINVV